MADKRKHEIWYQWPDGSWRSEKPHPRGKGKPAEARTRRGPRKGRLVIEDAPPSKRGRPRKPIPSYVEPSEEEVFAGLTDTCRRCERNFLLVNLRRSSMYCTECQRIYSRSFIKKAKLRENYGITLDEYNEMLEMTGGRCPICKIEFDKEEQRWPVVDHCHSSGQVRGILCNRCNCGLGYFRDNPKFLQQAAVYAQQFFEQG